MSPSSEAYLRPYRQAARRHGARFESLLWASPATQALRFQALVQLEDFCGANVLDAGCGRADLLNYLIHHGNCPVHYTGIEAVGELAREAHRRHAARAAIIQADFVKDPASLFVGADAIVFCGSLNTLDVASFHATLRAGFEATSRVLLFNFLSSPALANAPWLTWHPLHRVLRFARHLSADVSVRSDYLEGDCTVAVRR